MKKRMWLVILMGLFCCILMGCQCEHEWKEATCMMPKTCSICNETEGDPLGHNWKSATCTDPETCSRCEETRGVAVDHKWNDATCSAPKTCSVCSKTEGVALEHQEGDWEVVESNMVAATEVLKKYCIVCNEQLDRKERDMDSVHDTYHFLFTPKEFTDRLSDKLQSYTECNLIACTGSSEDEFACGIVDADTYEKAGIFLFVGDGNSITTNQKHEVCFDGALGSVQGADNIAAVILALVETCDPSLSFSEAKDLGSEIISGNEITRNGITYIFSYDDDQALILFVLSE